VTRAGLTAAQQTEVERIDRETDALIGNPDAMRRVVRNAYRQARREHLRQPIWSFVMDLFCTGSTYAITICRKLDLDPDATGRAALVAAGLPQDKPARRLAGRLPEEAISVIFEVRDLFPASDESVGSTPFEDWYHRLYVALRSQPAGRSALAATDAPSQKGSK
jgi:hypothetical protein